MLADAYERALRNMTGRQALSTGALLAVAMAAGVAPRAGAATYYWDTNGANAGATDDTAAFGASGVWNNVQALWNTDSGGGGGSFTPTTTTADTLHFSAGTNAIGTSLEDFQSQAEAVQALARCPLTGSM